jgi:uncharacterized glyoxalase superfamily protein PhnB
MEEHMVKPVPDGYHTLTPYFVVPDGESMLRFLQEAFGAKILFRHDRPDGALMHAELELGDSKVMVGQANEQFTPRSQMTYVYVPDVDAAYKRAIAAGGRSLKEVADQFYGDRSGGFEDPAGNCWWVATHVEDVSEAELTRRVQAQERSAENNAA